MLKKIKICHKYTYYSPIINEFLVILQEIKRK